MEFLQDLFLLLGRACIGLVFLWGSYDMLKNWAGTQEFMRNKNIPKLNIVLPVSVALRVLGGLSIFLGWYAHLGAFLLLVVAIPSAVFMHPFWKEPEGERKLQKLIFLKEIGVIGGLLLILALGAGDFGFN